MSNFVEQMSLQENNTEPKLERARQSESEGEGNEDRLSDLPDSLVLRILSFVNLKAAVQTSTLSRRWKDLWKQLPSLILHYSDLGTDQIFNKLVPMVLSLLRDGSVASHALDFMPYAITDPHLLERVLSYAISHMSSIWISTPFVMLATCHRPSFLLRL